VEYVNSIMRAVQIIDIIKQEESASYTRILKQCPIPRSTLAKILATLEAAELVRREPEHGRYELGVKLIEWGGYARSNLEIRDISRPIMKELQEAFICTVHLSVEAHGEVLPIDSVESKTWHWYRFRYPVALGIPAPMHATGDGKAILAFLEPERIAQIVREKGLERFTPTTITDSASLDAELEEIRRVGFAISDGEHDELIRSVAAPIFSHEGHVVAAVSVIGLASSITPKLIPRISKRVVEATAEISRLLGHGQSGSSRLQ
jgi:DNA-binding IclR family transcriptional regulator